MMNPLDASLNGGSHVSGVLSFPEQVLEEGVAFVHQHKLTIMDLENVIIDGVDLDHPYC
jgi:hypothetical protein